MSEAKTDLNVIVGLCIGHDILFARHSTAPGVGPPAGTATRSGLGWRLTSRATIGHGEISRAAKAM